MYETRKQEGYTSYICCHKLYSTFAFHKLHRGVHACCLKPRTASLHVLFELDMIIKLEMQIKLLLVLRRFWSPQKGFSVYNGSLTGCKSRKSKTAVLKTTICLPIDVHMNSKVPFIANLVTSGMPKSKFLGKPEVLPA